MSNISNRPGTWPRSPKCAALRRALLKQGKIKLLKAYLTDKSFFAHIVFLKILMNLSPLFGHYVYVYVCVWWATCQLWDMTVFHSSVRFFFSFGTTCQAIRATLMTLYLFVPGWSTLKYLQIMFVWNNNCLVLRPYKVGSVIPPYKVHFIAPEQIWRNYVRFYAEITRVIMIIIRLQF